MVRKALKISKKFQICAKAKQIFQIDKRLKIKYSVVKQLIINFKSYFVMELKIITHKGQKTIHVYPDCTVKLVFSQGKLEQVSSQASSESVITASTYRKDGKNFVSARELVASYQKHGYCHKCEAEQILGACHKEKFIADETCVSEPFKCLDGEIFELWKQNDGNLALLALKW